MSISMSNLALSMLLTQKLCRLVDNLGRIEKNEELFENQREESNLMFYLQMTIV